MKKNIFIFCLISLIFVRLKSQNTSVYTDNENLYFNALEFFDKKQYSAALVHFTKYLDVTHQPLHEIDSKLYQSICKIELFHKDGDWDLKQFIQKYPTSNKLKKAYYYLAISNFRKKKFEEVISTFNQVEEDELTLEEKHEFYFKRGYSYFSTNNLDNATNDFKKIVQDSSKYQESIRYYLAYINYINKNYTDALKEFNVLKKSETFSNVVPFYIIQINFLLNKFDDVIIDALEFIKTYSDSPKLSELYLLLSDTYFTKSDFSNTLHYYHKADSLEVILDKNMCFKIGYAYFFNKQFDKAIAKFSKNLLGQDSISQISLYYLAKCYLHQNEKLKARQALLLASELNFDKTVSEESFFNYSKLCYELTVSPFNDAITAFQNFTIKYPNSTYKNEAFQYLTHAYSSSKNYNKAIYYLELMDIIPEHLKSIYQTLHYNKANKHFQNTELDSAIKHYKKAIKINTNKKITANALFELGNVFYNLKDYETAVNTWLNYQNNEASYNQINFDLSNYQIGYGYFQQKNNYEKANIAFRKFLLSKNFYGADKKPDAVLRIADSYFMQGVFEQAKIHYTEALETNKREVEYCLYQKALCEGLTNQYEAKIATLNQLIKIFPNSEFIASFYFEIAETQNKNLSKYQLAITSYQKLLSKFPKSIYANKAYGGIGLGYYNLAIDDSAFYYFDKLVKINPTDDAAKNVLPYIKKIFETAKKLNEMDTYFNIIGQPLSNDEMEEAYYENVREAYYISKNYALTIEKVEAYLQKFKSGKNTIEINHCLAESALKLNQLDKAILAYQYVIEKDKNIFSENALLKTTQLLIKTKNYAQCVPLYKKLELYADNNQNRIIACLGLLKCQFYLSQFDEVLIYANKLLAFEQLPPHQILDAQSKKAKSLFELKRYNDALTDFKLIVKNHKNINAAEAQYYIAQIQYVKSELELVEKSINTLLNFNFSTDELNTNGLLLLVETYIKKNDLESAELMLKTIIDNKSNQQLTKIAIDKLEQVKVLKAYIENQKKLNVKQFKIDLNNTTDKKLFIDSDTLKPANTSTITPISTGTILPNMPNK